MDYLQFRPHALQNRSSPTRIYLWCGNQQHSRCIPGVKQGGYRSQSRRSFTATINEEPVIAQHGEAAAKTGTLYQQGML